MKRVLIIGEAGVNHNGEMTKAKELIDVAVAAGVDLVKFQTFKAENLVSQNAKKAEYQITNTGGQDDSQYSMLKKLELSHEDHLELRNYCQVKGIGFFSTAFDVDGLDYLSSLGFSHFKVPSGEITNYPYLKKLSGLGKPVILSTGMASLEEVEQAVSLLTSQTLEKKDITVLHCNTEYPTPMDQVNLMAMQHIQNELEVNIGYSDHTMGIEVPIAAVALGATVIEKHFTLSRELPGPDHKASLEPNELRDMVSAIRKIEKALTGSGIKEMSASESKNKVLVRKSVYTKREINEGEVILESDLIALRPGDGISPMEWENIVGAKAVRKIEKLKQLKYDDFTTSDL